jgi:hypothetical protein
MANRLFLRLTLVLLSTQLLACGGTQMGRIGPPVPLPNGAPRSACEREGWYELAPARVQSQAMTAGIGYNTIYTKTHVGAAVFTVGSNDPEKLKDLWPQMAERTLQLKHDARIKPVDDAALTSHDWALGGLAGLVGGVGIAAATQEDSKTTAAIFGVSGVAIGLVGVVGALVTQPSGLDQLEAEARRKLFFPKEDDLTDVERGVNRLNSIKRLQCGGSPVEFPPTVKPAPLSGTQTPIAPSTSATPTPASVPPPVAPTTTPPTVPAPVEPPSDPITVEPNSVKTNPPPANIENTPPVGTPW